MDPRYFFYQLCPDYSLTEHIEGASAGFEHTPASRYSNVSRHYSLPIGGPSLWVGDPVVALRVRYLLPNDLRCSHLRLLLGSSSILCSCYAPRSHVEGGRTLPLQEVEGRHNRQQEQYFDYSRDQPFNRSLGDSSLTIGDYSASRGQLLTSRTLL
jgi:hypothetical protein